MTSPRLRYGAALGAAFFYALALAAAPAAFLPTQISAAPAAFATVDPAPGLDWVGQALAIPAPPRGETGAPWPTPPGPLLVASEAETGAETRPTPPAACPAYQLPTAMLWARWAPHDLDVATLAPDLARAVTAEVNRIPPVTEWTPLRVKIAEGQAATAVVLEFADGCAWTSGPRPKPEIRALLNRAAARGA